MRPAILVALLLALSACGQPPGSTASDATTDDGCFGVAGTWTSNTGQTLRFGHHGMTNFCWMSSRCGSDWVLRNLAGDGAAEVSTYGSLSIANGQPPGPECPGITSPDRITCQFQVSGNEMTFNCGTAPSAVYRRSP